MKNKLTIVRQQDQSDCGVACLLSVLKHYGGNSSFEKARRLSGTNSEGTTLLGLYQAAQQLGFNAEGCQADIEALFQHNKPLILHITLENSADHYVVCFGTTINKGKIDFIIGDPAIGIVNLSTEQLTNLWKSGNCLLLDPNTDFVTAASTNKTKRQWIKSLIKEDIALLSMAAGLGIIIATLSLIMAWFSQRLIDDILPNKDFTKLTIGIVLVCLLMLSKEAISVVRQYFLMRQTKNFNERIISFFFAHFLQLPKSFFDTRKIGDITARLNDTSRIQRVISQLASSVIIDILMVIVATVFVFSYSVVIGIACMALIPVYFMLIYANNKKIMQGQRAIMVNYANTEANYISTFQGIEPIKNHNKQIAYSSKNNETYKKYQESVYSLGTVQVKLSFFLSCIRVLFLMAILFYGSKQVLDNQLKIGQLMAVLTMCGTLLPSVASLALIAIPISEASIAFNRLFEFVEIKAEAANESADSFVFKSLEIQSISFRFPGRKQIFQNVSFSVKKGEIIAIMGENGCGKSTISQIIQQHYLFESGNITINNACQLSAIPLTDWRQITAMAPQNIHIFNCTVLENIAFEDAINQPQHVAQFLNAYGFAPFLDHLPQSIMTIVGEEGINLSGGQKQIIALARALYHKPQLLILDEATAAMDRDTEQFVLKLLSQLKKEMGIIFITHRLHVLKSFCDRIYILENGTIAAQGNHEMLLESSNLYSKYWRDLVS